MTDPLPLATSTDPGAGRYAFYARVAGSTAYLTGALLATNAGLFGCDVLLARFLTPGDYGLVIYLTGIVIIVVNLSDFGLSRYLPSGLASALVRRETPRANRLCGNALIVQILVAVMMAAGLGVVFFRAPAIIDAVRSALGLAALDVSVQAYAAPLTLMFVLWMLILPLVRLVTSVYDGYQQMRFSFLAALVREPVRTAAIAAALMVAVTPQAALLGQGLATLPILALNGVLLVLFRRANPGLRFAAARGGYSDLIRNSLYYYIPCIGLWLFPELIKVMTGTFDAPETVGRLKICIGLSSLAFVGLAAVQRALLPAFSEKAADKPILQASFLGLLKMAGCLSFLVFVFMVTAGPWLVRWVFGPQYPVTAIHDLLIILSLAAFFEGYRLLTEPMLQGTGHFRILGAVELLRIVIFVALAAVLIPRWSGLGVTVAVALAALVTWGLRFACVHRRVVRLPWAPLGTVAVLVTAIALAALIQWTILVWTLAAVTAALMVLQFSRGELQTIGHSLRLFLRRK